MRLLHRYLLRQLAAPFVFALAALTSLMLLSQVAKKFGALVGKGLPWGVIGEVFALSLPFIIAMTLPMAVLLAVLYAFSHLAADNEITAMRASGISVYQILVPVLAWGLFMSAFNFVFVDQLLPRSNARLRGLLIDIGRKKPTFELREQVINEVPPSQYFLRAGRIDAATGRMKDITIYDVGGETSRRIIYADSGQMAYGEGQTDLNLRLYDGAIHQYRPADPLTFQLTYYHVNNIRVKDVYDELVRNSTETVRGDREMSTCEMLTVIREAHADLRGAGQDRRELLVGDLRALLTLPPVGPPPPDRTVEQPPAYCRLIDRLQGPPAPPKTAEVGMSAHEVAVDQQGASAGSQEPAPKAQQPTPKVQQPMPKLQQPAAPPPRRPPLIPGQNVPAKPGKPQAAARPGAPRQAAAWSGQGAPAAQFSQTGHRGRRPAPARQLGADRDRGRSGPGCRPPGGPVRRRGPQEVVHQLRLRLVRDRGHRDGAAVPARRDRAGHRRRHVGVLDPLRRAHGRRKPRRPGADLALAGHVGAQHHADRARRVGAAAREP